MADDTTNKTNGIDETLPDIVKNFLKSGGKLEDITLHDDGKWTHEGLDFENPKIQKLFSRSVSRTEGGTWVLEVGRFTYPINVEDTGFFIKYIDTDASPPVVTVSDGSEQDLDVATMNYAEGGRLYCTIKDGEFRARFKRQPYYKLAEHFEERDGQIFVKLDGHAVALTTMAAEE